ncbi:RNA-binding S4 domain-containing protein [Chenggangzhangella methanolivorans]|uniref:RNA-binding S4 domain-containing protein n=1 Tax=Chenggangzhangella methanolivorans TaxID=1437009 RepID=UPI00361B1A6B
MKARGRARARGPTATPERGSRRTGHDSGASPASPPTTSARVDVWMWRARVVKTRSLAAKLAQSGHVRLNGRRIDAAGRAVRVGDVLTIALDRSVLVLEIVDLGERRGPAVEAQMLYRNPDARD